jgi:hypothetical protein
MGFASIINLREPTESGANLEEEVAAAKAAGLRYYSIPLNANAPDPAAADKCLEAITQKEPSLHSSIALAGSAPPQCGSSSAWHWIIGMLIVRRRKLPIWA